MKKKKKEKKKSRTQLLLVKIEDKYFEANKFPVNKSKCVKDFME